MPAELAALGGDGRRQRDEGLIADTFLERFDFHRDLFVTTRGHGQAIQIRKAKKASESSTNAARAINARNVMDITLAGR